MSFEDILEWAFSSAWMDIMTYIRLFLVFSLSCYAGIHTLMQKPGHLISEAAVCIALSFLITGISIIGGKCILYAKHESFGEESPILSKIILPASAIYTFPIMSGGLSAINLTLCLLVIASITICWENGYAFSRELWKLQGVDKYMKSMPDNAIVSMGSLKKYDGLFFVVLVVLPIAGHLASLAFHAAGGA